MTRGQKLPENVRKVGTAVHFESNELDEIRKKIQATKRHHSLLISHAISTLFHLISSILLYLSWHSANLTCGETSVFLTNLQVVLVAIYGVTTIIKILILIKHFLHIRIAAKYITVITTIIAGKQFILAIISEVFLEASTMVPSSGCSEIRGTLPVIACRIFYLLSIVINAFFFAMSAKMHPAEN
ncbi:unnamed protein product [Cylicocyclus nassatus]|uniref:Uncharacterized protein n=1 Tax=Cylicocyclus nassatus TaxID=53992 RepID=A0AA36HBS4_CYLNA|nr:unnamed protein product [Cylicocyclus nassatus]